MNLKICNIQNFSIHDGPGIRTTLFLSGCPLRCTWCHNPETQSQNKVLVYENEKCIGCRECEKCENGVHIFSPEHKISRDKCMLCGKCINLCPSLSLEFSNRELSDEEFFQIVNKQKRLSGKDGGITFSGGEPLMQGETIIRLVENISIHKAIETSGYSDENLFKSVLKKMDYVMFDLKLADDNLHKKYTGVSNKLILKNLEILRSSGVPYILRTPLIPNITNTKENLKSLSEIVGNDQWEKLPYNTLTPAKYMKIGKIFKL